MSNETEIPAGWTVVPVEPTEAMIDAGCDLSGAPVYGASEVRNIWVDMIAAAPAATPSRDDARFALEEISALMRCFGIPGAKIQELTTRVYRGLLSVATHAAAEEPAPIDMVLHCPKCGMQHIDAPEDADCDGEVVHSFGWGNPPHRSHLCHGCGHIWRPADVPTNGVAAVKTAGKNDSPITGLTEAETSETASVAGLTSASMTCKLWDSQWVNIVNHANCYADFDKEEAVHQAVKLTEAAIAKNFREAASVAPATASVAPRHAEALKLIATASPSERAFEYVRGIARAALRAPAAAVQAEPAETLEQAHTRVQSEARRYGPLIRAALQLLVDVDARFKNEPPLKYTIPYGAVNALRDAMLGIEPPAATQPQATEREALDVDEIHAIYRQTRADCNSATTALEASLIFARAIERAHGINTKG